MTDINLLPIEQRKKEQAERKMADKMRDKVSFTMSDPSGESKDKPLMEQGNFKKSSPFGWLKKYFQKKKSKKQEKKLKKGLKKQAQKAEQEKKEQEKKDELRFSDSINKSPIHTKPEIHEKKPEDKKPIEPHKKEDLYYKLDVNRSKIEGYNKKEKSKYTPGKKIEDTFDIDLMPDLKRVWDIPLKVKIMFLLIAFVVIVIATAGIFIWLDLETKNEMKKVSSFDKRIELLQEKQSNLIDTNKEAVLLQEHLDVLGTLLDGHVYTSNAFKYLEETIVPGVYYKMIYLDEVNDTITLTIVALNYTEAAKQILVFEEDKENITTVKVNGLDLIEEKEEQKFLDEEVKINKFVEFEMDILLTPNFFNE
jgi:hypothetical protein